MTAGFRTPGGEGGIRTPGTGVSPYNGLANRRLQPLGHLSGDFHQFNMVCGGSSAGLHFGRPATSPLSSIAASLAVSPTSAALRLFLWTGLRRYQPRYPVVDGELTVVLSGMLDETVCHVGYADLLIAVGIRYQVGHALVARCLDGGRTVGKRLLHKSNYLRLGFVLVTLRIFQGGRFLTQYRAGEEIIRAGSVEELLCEAALCWSGFEVVLVLGKILCHGDQFPSNVVPRIKHSLRWAERRLGRGIFLGDFLCMSRKG